jgi:hypothetical protein
MAKELPYFKFFPEQWLGKKITLESYETQGIFINVCSIYWANECSIKIATLQKRYGDAINYLIAENFIKDKNGYAKISFLDSQWQERYKKHKELSNSGKIGAAIRWGKNSHPNGVANEDAIKKDIAIRKEKKIKEYELKNLKFLKEENGIDVFFEPKWQIEFTLDEDGSRIYGNLKDRMCGGLSEFGIQQHCENRRIEYVK